MPQLIRAATGIVTAAFVFSLNVSAGRQAPASTPASAAPGSKVERHLRNIRKLTSGGENAEAYFSTDGTRLIYQSTRPEYPCDQIYTMKLDGSDQRRVSTGTGRTTCGYFYPAGDEIVFASTHEAGAACPPRPSLATSGRSMRATKSIARKPMAPTCGR
jgi:TolB protein